MDPNKTGSEMDQNKTGSEFDNNLILQYLILDEVYSASFGSNFNQINQLQKSYSLSTLSKYKC